jgi:regulator of sigma E protease
MLEATFTTVIGFLVLISAVIVVHEWGHFVAARRMGVKVLAFSMGFGPVLWRRTGRDGVEYRLSAVPFGGYIRMAGEEFADERKGTPDEFLSAPIRRRVVIILAGPAMNLVLGWALCVGIHLWGLDAPAAEPRIAAVVAGTPAEAAGLRTGDRIVAIDGAPIAAWRAFTDRVAASPGRPLALVVERAGEKVPLTLTPATRSEEGLNAVGRAYARARNLVRGGGYAGAIAWIEPVVGTVDEGSPAEEAGIRPGERITAIDDTPVERWEEAAAIIHASIGETLAVTLADAGGGRRAVEVIPRLSVEPSPDGLRRFGAIGIGPVVRPDPRPVGEALLDGTAMTIGMGTLVFWTLEQIVRGAISPKLLAGPVGIAQMAGQKFRRGLVEYVLLTALISVNLCVVNLLPFPVLDGGWLCFFAYEAAVGRPMPQRVQSAIFGAGIAVLLALIVFITWNDIIRWADPETVQRLLEETR